METHVFAAVLFAAALHAGWNSIVKVGLDRVSLVLLLSLAQGGMALAALPFVSMPAAASWGWLVAAALLHTGYKLFLVQAYRHADLSQAYPLARGTAPLIVTVFSAVALGVTLETAQLAAVLAISAGLLLMAFRGGAGGRMTGPALFFAIGTAGFTASYTLVDGIGARLAGTASGFVLWMFLGDALGIATWAAVNRGRAAFVGLAGAWRPGVLAGAMSLGSYWIAVWAFTKAPIALVAALRETSILFAIVIGVVVLREPLTRWRAAAALSIAAGVLLLRV